jgi:hypothetical protein
MVDQVEQLSLEVVLRNKDRVDVELYSSYKAISKELFQTSEKEIIAKGRAYWEDIEQSGTLLMDFYPPKESQFKLTKNSLTLRERTLKLMLNYET